MEDVAAFFKSLDAVEWFFIVLLGAVGEIALLQFVIFPWVEKDRERAKRVLRKACWVFWIFFVFEAVVEFIRYRGNEVTGIAAISTTLLCLGLAVFCSYALSRFSTTPPTIPEEPPPEPPPPPREPTTEEKIDELLKRNRR